MREKTQTGQHKLNSTDEKLKIEWDFSLRRSARYAPTYNTTRLLKSKYNFNLFV